MRYRAFLYKTAAETAEAMEIRTCNRAIGTDDTDEWRRGAAKGLRKFDSAAVARQLEALADGRYRVVVKTPPRNGPAYLSVVTSYEMAPRMLPDVHWVAAQNDLVLYDGETQHVFYRELIDRALIEMKPRAAAIVRAIKQQAKPVWSVRRVEAWSTGSTHHESYVVTLRKDSAKPLEQRCEEFYRCLEAQLRPGERLCTEDECFTLEAGRYTIAFCLEGYKKHPNQKGYWRNGRPQTKLLRRIGCEEGVRQLQKADCPLDTVAERMRFAELQHACPNPADRYAASINLTKWQLRQKNIRYTAIGPYGSEIVFHIVPDEHAMNDTERLSMLAVEEDCAGPILAVVERFYPYIRQRYNLDDNHLPVQQWQKILEAAREERRRCLAECRLEDAEVLEVFGRWLDAQLELCEQWGWDGWMLNIQGP